MTAEDKEGVLQTVKMWMDAYPNVGRETVEHQLTKYISDLVDAREASAKEIIQEWVDKQGHERCWYYPDLFRSLADLFGIKAEKEPSLPPLEEFKAGCQRYQLEEFSSDEHSIVSYVPQRNAIEMGELLIKAGYGKPGTGNTLWAMVHQAVAEVEKLREQK